MGLYDDFVDETGEIVVQLKVTDAPYMETYRAGQTAPVPDGVYVGYEGVVVIREGRVALVTSHMHDKWGGWIEPRDVLAGSGPVAEGIANALGESS